MHRMGWMTGWLRKLPGASQRAEPVSGEGRQRLVSQATRAGFPLVPAAHPAGFGCSCDRVGCPVPATHPVSFGWQTQATTDPAWVEWWLHTMPEANFVTATGRVHDVLDVPGEVGRAALRRIAPDSGVAGPVVLSEPDRYLFFTSTRATLDEDEWWPCELDCHPDTLDEHPGLRWHCRGSYVLLPPSRQASGAAVSWLWGPELPLPDPLRVLDVLTEVWPADLDPVVPHGPW